MKVLLRSQSNFTPPLLVYARPAYGDTKGRSISIADGAARGRKSVELALICVVNLPELTRVAANVSPCDNQTSVGKKELTGAITIILMGRVVPIEFSYK